MHDRIERMDAPEEGGPRRPDLARDDLRQRLGRLADGHPASERYRTAEDGRPDDGPDASRTDADPDASRTDADPDGSRTDADPDASRTDAVREGATGDMASREEPTGGRDDNRDATGRASSAWDSLSDRSRPDRPAEADIGVSADREGHILDGEPDSDGGGHRHGTGRPGKTEFPREWPDNEIMSVVEDVSRNPDHVEWQPNGRWRVSGDHDGVRVHAIVRPDGRIWTAWPEPGGKGVVQNPEAS